MGDTDKILDFIYNHRHDIINTFKSATPNKDGVWEYYNPINSFYTDNHYEKILKIYKKLKATVIVEDSLKKRVQNIPLSYFVWIMEFIVYDILYSYGIEMNLGKNKEKTINSLLMIVKRNYETKAFCMDNVVSSLTSVKTGSKALRVDRSFFKRLIMLWKRNLMGMLCYISYKYSYCDNIPHPIHYNKRITTTMMFLKFRNEFINQTDKTKLLQALIKLPQLFGEKCMKDVFRRMTRECLLIILMCISALDNHMKKKFISLYESHGKSNFLCTCNTKCTRWYNNCNDSGNFDLDEIRQKRECLLHVQNTWAVCSLCGETPSLLNRKLVRCRRSLNPYSYTVSCSICGNTSFKDVHMYLCKVTRHKTFFYRHLAYTGNIVSYENKRNNNPVRAHYRIGSLCFGGSRTCFKRAAFLDREPGRCHKCDNNPVSNQETCSDQILDMLSPFYEFDYEKFSSAVQKMCSGCILFIFCPTHHSSIIPYRIIQNVLLST
jgi:hypothetical protein